VLLFLSQRRHHGDPIDRDARFSIVAFAILGGAIGARLLYWLEDPAATEARWYDFTYLFGGKTVVGGLLGGLIAVELVKRRLGIVRRTGDILAAPLAFGIAIGRLGCFLTGLTDRTYGVATHVPWAVDFGDGVPRHPTQLYESIVLVLLGVLLLRLQRQRLAEGRVFQIFMAGYLSLRLVMDAIKPEVRLALGLSALQWAALVGLAYYVHDWRRLSLTNPAGPLPGVSR
jgi:phosphatidylglycerol:prolipoprotein diacylglycerol transferase